MTGRSKKRMPGLMKAWLLVNPQSESAEANVRRLLAVLTDEQLEELRGMIVSDLKPRMEQQIDALREQIEQMEDGGGG